MAAKRLFNAVKRIRWATEPEGKSKNLDMALQTAKIIESSTVAHALIKEFEQCRLQAYLCPAGIWTIGWGHTKGVRSGDSISVDQAEHLFQEDIKEFDAGVARLIKVPVEQYQFDALVSFAFNVGLDIDADIKPEGLGDSFLLKHVNAGNFTLAAAEFEKWVTGGRPRRKLPGLVRRRKKERALFEGKYNY